MFWPTPRASEAGPDFAKEGRSDTGMALPAAAAQWPTPAARDYKGANSAEHAASAPGAAHLDQLPNFVEHLWPTPTSLSFGESHQPGNSKSYNATMRLASFLPDRPISTVGEESSHIRRSLNPLFVEWLMGWPPGWTLLAPMPLASIACGCSATGLSSFKARMRSELLRLGLPPEAPPVQPSLF